MSSQGSGEAIQAYSFEEELLKAWGLWARSSSLGMGYSSLKDLTPGEVPLFGENQILVVDRVIAGMPKAHKRTIKRAFWFCDAETLRDSPRCGQAIAEFSDHWHLRDT